MNGQIRVLLIDDNPQDRELVKDALEKESGDFKVFEAGSRAEFEQWLAKDSFDLILSDLNILGFTGFQLLNTVQARLPHVPVVILTGTGSEEGAVEALKLGASDYVLKKPVHIRRLPNTIRSVLEAKGLKDKLSKAEQERDRLFELSLDPLCIAGFDGYFKQLNPAWESILGWTRAELMSRPYLSFVHTDDREATSRTAEFLTKGKQVLSFENRYQTINGDYKWLSWNSYPLVEEGLILAVVHDVTEQKQAMQEIRAALKDKEILLSELYHRLRNNMQRICSILVLYAESTDNKQVHQMVRDTISRIQAMALVQQKLYQSRNLSMINLDEYLKELGFLLLKTYHTPQSKVKLLFDLEPIPVLFDLALPCGLILTELVSNALHYAFPGDQKGEISISLHRTDQHIITLGVADNGLGLPQGFQFTSPTTVGMRTLLVLAEHQLQGKISFQTAKGVSCQVSFSEDLYRPRI